MDEDLLHDLPEEYAALADRRTVMLEVAAQLKELHVAVTHLGDALERAGLPGREWRSADAHFRVLPSPLPNITVDAFITRVAEFAAGKGPAWLRGDDRDLEAFHNEVGAIYAVVQRLLRVAQDLRGEVVVNRRSARLALALASEEAVAALDRIDAILGDFKALRPFMAPLSRQDWGGYPERSSRSEQAEHLGAPAAPAAPAASSPRGGRDETLPLSATKPHRRLLDFAHANGVDSSRGRWRVGSLIAALRRRIVPLRAWSPAQKQLAAVAIVVVLGLLGIGLEVVLSQPRAPASLAARTGQSSPTATATAVPATSTPRRSAAPPRLTLTCSAQDSTARLTIQNVGTATVTWQAQSPSGLRIDPDHGSLNAGQSATAQVSTSRQQVTGTITVTATERTTSASFSVTCA